MYITILEILTLIALPIVAAKGPSTKNKLKYSKPGAAKISAQYAVNPDGEIEELLNKEGKNGD